VPFQVVFQVVVLSELPLLQEFHELDAGGHFPEELVRVPMSAWAIFDFLFDGFKISVFTVPKQPNFFVLEPCRPGP